MKPSHGSVPVDMQQLIDSLHTIVWIFDRTKQKILFVSDAFERVIGIPAAAVYADYTAPFSLVMPEDLPGIQAQFEALIRGEDLNWIGRIRRPDGEIRIHHLRSFSVTSATQTKEQRLAFCVAEDITALAQKAERAVHSEKTVQGMLDAITDSIFLIDIKGNLLALNAGSARRIGRPLDEMLGKCLWDFFPEQVSAHRKEYVRNVVRTGKPVTFTDTRAHYHFQNTLWPLFDDAGNVVSIAAYARDITEEKLAKNRAELITQAFECSGEAMLITTPEGMIVEVNRAFTEITGYEKKEAIGKTPAILKSGRHEKAFYDAMWATLRSEGKWEGEVYDKRKNGEIYPKWLVINSLRDSDGILSHYVALFNDISGKKKAEEHLYRIAYYDTLTELPNRLLFTDRLEQSIAYAARHDELVAVLFLDLDGFKVINDTLGHTVGDALLKAVADRLSGLVRESDTVSRLGGDEYAILLTNVRELRDVSQKAREIVEELQKPFVLGERDIFLTTSMGIVLFPYDGTSPEELFRNADTAMYHAKSQGKNAFQYYSEEMNKNAEVRLTVETGLRYAIARNELVLMYQPKLELATGKITGVEALIRWKHPEKGMVSPGLFIPVAEETGLILQIGEWVMNTAVEEIGRLNRSLDEPITVAVNLSARQFRQRDLLALLRIASSRAAGQNILEVEITESAVMDNPASAIRVMEEIRDLGLSIAMDDFGTGYSSLSYLKKFPISTVKIDRSFIMNCPGDVKDTALTKTIVTLAHNLDMKVVAEGVETEEQLNFLKGLGCDLSQGFFTARPMPVEQLRQFLSTFYGKND